MFILFTVNKDLTAAGFHPLVLITQTLWKTFIFDLQNYGRNSSQSGRCAAAEKRHRQSSAQEGNRPHQFAAQAVRCADHQVADTAARRANRCRQPPRARHPLQFATQAAPRCGCARGRCPPPRHVLLLAAAAASSDQPAGPNSRHRRWRGGIVRGRHNGLIWLMLIPTT